MDALWIHLMFALAIRTEEVKNLRFEDLDNQNIPTIKAYDLHKRKGSFDH